MCFNTNSNEFVCLLRKYIELQNGRIDLRQFTGPLPPQISKMVPVLNLGSLKRGEIKQPEVLVKKIQKCNILLHMFL